MGKIRKDTKGRVLRKGEMLRRDTGLYRFAYTDQFGNRKYLYSKDLGELREKEKQVQHDKLDGINTYAVSGSDVNFVFDRYISTKNELRSSTRTNYIYTYDRYVRKGFGKKKIAEVRYSEVVIFYNALLDSGLSVSTVESVHSTLHPTFQMAVRDNVIRNNPTDGVLAEIKKKQKGRPEVRHALTLEQERAFLNYLENPEYDRWRPMFTVMFGTGARIGELIDGLRWADVDFNKNLIRIDHSVSYYPRSDKGYKCEYEITPPKTEGGIRTIPMLDKVREALLEEQAYQNEHGTHCVMELGGMSGFIFSNRFGNLHKPSGIDKVIKRIVDNYNAAEEVKAAREGREPILIPRFSCHITRHTFCSRLCENETNVKVIQSVMGHKDIQTTLDIYAEVSENKRQEVFKNLNNHNVL